MMHLSSSKKIKLRRVKYKTRRHQYVPSKVHNSISAGALTIHKYTRYIPMLFKLMIKAIMDTAI